MRAKVRSHWEVCENLVYYYSHTQYGLKSWERNDGHALEERHIGDAAEVE